MELWKEFIETTSLTAEILEKYLEMRLRLKELGYTEDSIKTINKVDVKLFKLRDDIMIGLEKLKSQLKNYGFDVNSSKINDYLESKFDNINKLTPLNDGNNKRDNPRNEDY